MMNEKTKDETLAEIRAFVDALKHSGARAIVAAPMRPHSAQLFSEEAIRLVREKLEELL